MGHKKRPSLEQVIEELKPFHHKNAVFYLEEYKQKIDEAAEIMRRREEDAAAYQKVMDFLADEKNSFDLQEKIVIPAELVSFHNQDGQCGPGQRTAQWLWQVIPGYMESVYCIVCGREVGK